MSSFRAAIGNGPGLGKGEQGAGAGVRTRPGTDPGQNPGRLSAVALWLHCCCRSPATFSGEAEPSINSLI